MRGVWLSFGAEIQAYSGQAAVSSNQFCCKSMLAATFQDRCREISNCSLAAHGSFLSQQEVSITVAVWFVQSQHDHEAFIPRIIANSFLQIYMMIEKAKLLSALLKCHQVIPGVFI